MSNIPSCQSLAFVKTLRVNFCPVWSLASFAPKTHCISCATVPMAQSIEPRACKTVRWNAASKEHIADAAAALQAGKIVAFPTETVYGLGADATNDNAVGAVFAAKGRPVDNPLIVHFSSKRALIQSGLVRLPLGKVADLVTDSFWPGPLTVVLPLANQHHVSSLVTAGLDSVAVRVPAHPIARALLEKTEIPIAAPSANMSGRPSPTEPEHVLADLESRIDGIVDNAFPTSSRTSGTLQCGLESTVVSLLDETQPVILRPGSVAASELSHVAGIAFKSCASLPEDVDSRSNGGAAELAPRAPGMKYRHYAPQAPLVLCNRRSLQSELARQLQKALPQHSRVGLLADAETCVEVGQDDLLVGVVCVPCGRRDDAASVARDLYSALRAFDGEGPNAVPAPGVAVIVAVALDDAKDGVAAAVMNRLRKAATAYLSGHGAAGVGLGLCR